MVVSNTGSADVRLVVKHTFLEFVDLDGAVKTQGRPRGYTDCLAGDSSDCTGTLISESETNATASDVQEQEQDVDGVCYLQPSGPRDVASGSQEEKEEEPQQQPLAANQIAVPSPITSTLLLAGASPSWSPWRRPDELPDFSGGEFYFEPLPTAFWTPADQYGWEEMACAATYGGMSFDTTPFTWDGRNPDDAWFAGMGMDFANITQDVFAQPQPSPTSVECAADAPAACDDALVTAVVASSHGGNRAERKTRSGNSGAATTSRVANVALSNKAGTHTTVMLRNLPAGFTQSMLFDLITSAGFSGRCSFVYLPIDFVKQVSLGYALVDLPSPADAQAFFEYFDGYSDWSFAGATSCSASWSDPHQGLEQLVERYRSSPVMHHFVPEEWKPVILQDGLTVTFPSPKKAIKAPKIRGGYEVARQNF